MFMNYNRMFLDRAYLNFKKHKLRVRKKLYFQKFDCIIYHIWKNFVKFNGCLHSILILFSEKNLSSSILCHQGQGSTDNFVTTGIWSYSIDPSRLNCYFWPRKNVRYNIMISFVMTHQLFEVWCTKNELL